MSNERSMSNEMENVLERLARIERGIAFLVGLHAPQASDARCDAGPERDNDKPTQRFLSPIEVAWKVLNGRIDLSHVEKDRHGVPKCR